MNFSSTVTLRQLRAFAAVAAHGSFAAASQALHLTPSALSLLVKELERALDVRLFERSTRQTSLTLPGAELLPLANKVLDDLQRAIESTRELQQKKRGTVRIACTPLYAAMLLPGLIARYHEQFPAIEIFVLDSLHQEALHRVATGEADFGIAPQRTTPPEFIQQRLFKDRICLLCPPDHALAKRPSVTWEQIIKEPFVTLTHDFTARLQADLLRHSATLVLQPAYQVSFLTTALGMVRAGLGITAQPLHAEALAATFGLIVRRITSPVVYRQLSVFTKRRGGLSPAATSFRDFVNLQMTT